MLRLRYSSLFTLISSKRLAISSVTKAIKRNMKQPHSFVIVFRDHKQENKRKEMLHQCYMFAIIFDSLSTSWELRNSSNPFFFSLEMWKTSLQVLPKFKDVFFSTDWASIQTSIVPVVYIWELRNSVLPMLFHGWKCERRAFDFYPYFHNSKMLFSADWLQFKHLHHLHLHGNGNLPNERPYGTWNILRERETIIIGWIWLNGLHTYWVL